MSGRIADKVCVVTGAGSGIGRATAVRFAREGGKVLCADVNGATAIETAELIQNDGGEAVARTVDVSDPRAVDAMIAEAVERFGGIDVLVNNAGVNIPGVLHEVTDEVIERTLAVNVNARSVAVTATCSGRNDGCMI
jgi:dihydroanticapsin dehydrogenase